jgi:hypothetical protein
MPFCVSSVVLSPPPPVLFSPPPPSGKVAKRNVSWGGWVRLSRTTFMPRYGTVTVTSHALYLPCVCPDPDIKLVTSVDLVMLFAYLQWHACIHTHVVVSQPSLIHIVFWPDIFFVLIPDIDPRCLTGIYFLVQMWPQLLEVGWNIEQVGPQKFYFPPVWEPCFFFFFFRSSSSSSTLRHKTFVASSTGTSLSFSFKITFWIGALVPSPNWLLTTNPNPNPNPNLCAQCSCREWREAQVAFELNISIPSNKW